MTSFSLKKTDMKCGYPCCQIIPSEEPRGWLEPAVWVTLHPSWLSPLSPPQERACKHHDTFVIIKSFHPLLGEREWNKKCQFVMTLSRKANIWLLLCHR